MTKLSAEAYAIVEGRHADPFHYLGLHSEGDHTVVRAFLPEASKVDAIDEHGETATLARIHDAGLFAGALPNGSRRYQLRASVAVSPCSSMASTFEASGRNARTTVWSPSLCRPR